MAIDWRKIGRTARENPRQLAAVLAVIVAIVLIGRALYNYQQRVATETEENPAEKLDREKKKKDIKPDFETFRLVVHPGEPEQGLHPIKPGHWFGGSLNTKANNFDFVGTVATSATDKQGQPIDLVQSPYHLTSIRPAILPKAQKKQLELAMFVPPGSQNAWLSHRLADRYGREAKLDMDLVELMPAYQYYFVVLSREPTRYRYIKVLDSVSPPSGSDIVSRDSQDRYYQVVIPPVKDYVQIPSQPLAWSSVAYLLWDDVDPTALVPEQRQALVDWLYWGGQLIVSGPQTLDLLKGSFLEPHLPALGGGNVTLETAGLAELSTYWTLPEKNRTGRPITPAKPWSAVKLMLADGGKFVPNTGELVAERNLGRGRIVATSFRLNERELINWRSYDSFFNSVLLARPTRKYTLDQLSEGRIGWQDSSAGRFDPRLISAVRYFARDAGNARFEAKATEDAATQPTQPATPALPAPPRALQPPNVAMPGPYGYVEPESIEQQQREQAIGDGGMGAWSDFGPVPQIVRSSLREAAGISVPRPGFVIGVLCAYLIVLVPVNWAVFKAIGRVELAWVAAPLISIVCAAVVIRMARLDIGFAQSRTEIATLELQAGHPRAHLARYTALYTSLSGGYNLEFADSSALAAPFASDAQLVRNQARSSVTLEHDDQVRLKGFDVASNSTGMLRSEQMFDVGGPITWQAGPTPHLVNETKFRLRGAGVVRRTAAKQLEAAWLGDLAPGANVAVQLAPIADTSVEVELERVPVFAAERPEDTLSLRPLWDLAASTHDLLEGEIRMLAWLEEDLTGGVAISPSPSQTRQATLVVVNLARPDRAPPRPDANSRSDVMNVRDLEKEADGEVDPTKEKDSGPAQPPDAEQPAEDAKPPRPEAKPPADAEPEAKPTAEPGPAADSPATADAPKP